MDNKMPFIIVVEGPDGAGKTTLIHHLTKDLGMERARRFSTSTGGPLDNIYELTVIDLNKPQQGKIYDRHPAISNAIYDRALDRPMDERFLSVNYQHLRAQFFARARLVLCMPPTKVIRRNLKVERQLPGVDENINEVIEGYRRISDEIAWGNWPGWAYIYDYTKPNAYQLLKENLCQI